MVIKKNLGQKTPKKRKITPIELDPQKDYLLVVSSSIPDEEYDSLCSQFDNYPNVIIVSADKPTVISLP